MIKRTIAASTWSQDSDTDFKNGTLNNTVINDTGQNAELRLITEKGWINKTALNSYGTWGHKIASLYNDDKVVLFGGKNGIMGYFNDTWIYDLSDDEWIEKFPTESPSARENHAMATIKGTDEIILFGGHDGSLTKDTWLYNASNNTWTNMNPLGSTPSARFCHEMVTGYYSDTVLLFGGNTGGGLNAETWEYNLSSNKWTNKNPLGSKPSARRDFAFTTIPGTDKVLLFGGSSGGNETWVYNFSDNTWTKRLPNNRPSVRKSSGMSGIYGDDKIVLFGGYDYYVGVRGDTWIYDLSDNEWTQQTLKIKPSIRTNNNSMTCFYGTNKVLLFGGYKNDALNDTWIYYLSSNEDNGTFISIPFNSLTNSSFKTLIWNAFVTSNTFIKFQIRTGINEFDLINREFLGPDGTSKTYYDISPSTIWSGHNGYQWIQIKAFLFTNISNETPILRDITLLYNCWPNSTLVNPINNCLLNKNKPNFVWNFLDKDSSQQTSFQVIIDDDPNFNSVDYDSKEQASSQQSWQFPTGTIYSELADGTWYWKVRIKDNDGEWGYFSPPFKLIIDAKVPFSTINYPLNNSYLNQINLINGISSDLDSSGINRTELSILKVDPNPINNEYWDGNNWIKNEIWLNTIGTEIWFFNASEVLWLSNFIYIIQSRAIDNAINIEFPSKGHQFIFDNIPPTITFFTIEDGKESINTPVVNISYKIKDNRARHDSYDTSFSFDNKIWTKWEPIIFDNITITLPKNDGIKYVYMKLRDRAENIAEIVNDSIILDTMPPEQCSIMVNKDDKYTRFQNITLTLFAKDSLSGINKMSFSFDSIEWTDWEAFKNEKTLNLPLKDGEKIIYFKVKDKANNIAEPVFDKINLDSIPPNKLSIIINENTEFTNSSIVNLKVTATDTHSGINEMSFSFDNNSWTPWENFNNEKSITLPPYDSQQYIYFKVSDKAGNIAEPIYDSIILDTTPPNSLSLKINNGDLETNTILVNLNINAIDETSGLFQMSFSDDGILWSEWEGYSSSKSYILTFGNGLKTIYLRVTDKAGNIADPISSSIIFNNSVTDLDLDGDGYPNDIDAFPNNPTQGLDFDGDNPKGTNPDYYPNDPTRWEKENESTDKKEPKMEEESNSPWVILGFIIIIILILIILFFLFFIHKIKDIINPKKPLITNNKALKTLEEQEEPEEENLKRF